MGLSSSQARMLTLKAEKSDLEFRAQCISQRKLQLSQQTQQLAMDYSNAISKRKLEMTYDLSQSDSSKTESMKVALSYGEITANNGKNIGDFVVTTSEGKYVAKDDQEDLVRIALKLATADLGADKVNSMKTDESSFNQLINKYAAQIEVIPAVDNTEFFQDALRNGGLVLQQLSSDKNAQYENISWSSLSFVSDVLDDTEVAVAQADYEAKSSLLATQDKKLDMELQQIETQHSAVKTEIDTVKGLIKDNIETGFKYFE